MLKLASIIDTVVAETATASVANATKLAGAGLSPPNTSPSISTELSVALVKTAASLRGSAAEISHEDLKHFMERLRNA